MKRFLSGTIGAIIGIYFVLSTVVFVPYFNWTYARDHGFVKWILLGEVVATAKAFGWPFFVFRGTSGTEPAPHSEAERRYINSKKACDEALRVVVARGDVTKLTSAESEEVARLLQLALSEAQLVDSAYLAKVHQEFPIRYAGEYIKGLQLLADGLKRQDKALSLAGSYGYNEFAAWMDRNKKNLKW